MKKRMNRPGIIEVVFIAFLIMQKKYESREINCTYILKQKQVFN